MPSTRSRLPPGLLRAYRATAYGAGGAVAWVGRRSPGVDALLRSRGLHGGVFLGAANPWSRRAPEGVNRRLGRALLDHLRGVAVWPGAGAGRGWSEPHVLAGLAPARAAVLARRFRQRAIVVVKPGRPARLLLL